MDQYEGTTVTILPDCTDCESVQQVLYDNGCFCAGLVKNPVRLCDELRLCQKQDEEIVFAVDLASDEVASVLAVLSGALGEWLVRQQLRPCSAVCSQFESCVEIAGTLKKDAPGSETGGS